MSNKAASDVWWDLDRKQIRLKATTEEMNNDFVIRSSPGRNPACQV
jgi:hypothetical protein